MPSSVWVLSRDSEAGRHCLSVVSGVGSAPARLVSNVNDIAEITGGSGNQILFVDRALPGAELARLTASGVNWQLITFGRGRADSAELQAVESISAHQLRHPLTDKDVKRLLNKVNKTAVTATKTASSRSTHLYRGLVGRSESIRKLRDLIETVSKSRANILISGETGTGKEIVARNIHYYSDNGNGPFVAVNCAAIPPDLLESELFGHKKGAFTGALSNREGRFSMAADGTLFLDEIGDMTPSLQAKLLRVLEERIIYPVGSNTPVRMTARLVAATHRDLEQRVQDGSFREDLYYRLNVVPVSVPPLRDRKSDIGELAKELSCRLKREQGVGIELTPDAIQCLKLHNWPGNVRELSNLIERLAAVNPNGVADVGDLPRRFRAAHLAQVDPDEVPKVLSHSLEVHPLPEDGIDLRCYLRDTEEMLIRKALDHSGGAVTQAANLLHMRRTTLSEKIKRFGLASTRNERASNQ